MMLFKACRLSVHKRNFSSSASRPSSLLKPALYVLRREQGRSVWFQTQTTLSDVLGPCKASNLALRTCSTGSILLAHVHICSERKWRPTGCIKRWLPNTGWSSKFGFVRLQAQVRIINGEAFLYHSQHRRWCLQGRHRRLLGLTADQQECGPYVTGIPGM